MISIELESKLRNVRALFQSEQLLNCYRCQSEILVAEISRAKQCAGNKKWSGGSDQGDGEPRRRFVRKELGNGECGSLSDAASCADLCGNGKKPTILPRDTARECGGADLGHFIETGREFAGLPLRDRALRYLGDRSEFRLRETEHVFADEA
ncbi:hypothetical protein ACVWZ4_000023 [Bradyrhizobium sp. USDA 4472]